jgi:hypothetical protein
VIVELGKTKIKSNAKEYLFIYLNCRRIPILDFAENCNQV